MQLKLRAVSPRLFAVIAFVAVITPLTANVASGQKRQDRLPSNRDPIPTPEYWGTFMKLDQGELSQALDLAQRGLRQAPRGANGRFIDAICYHVSIGESFYKQGQYSEALVQYQNALLQFLLWPEWALKVDWPIQGQIRPHRPVKIAWGQTTRQNVQYADLGENQMMNRGGLIPIPGGAALNNARKFPINAIEIVRATAVAMQRYRELMGPTCQHELLVSKLDTALASAFPPNHYSQCFGDVLRGLVARMRGDEGQAEGLFKRGMLLGGVFDHPLTPIALYELGSISMDSGNFVKAIEEFTEATYTQAYYLYPAGPTLMERAFHNAYLCTQLSNRNGDYPATSVVAQLARQEEWFHITATMNLDMAEAALVAGDLRNAQQFLRATSAAFGRRDMQNGVIGIRFKHLSATYEYANGKVAAGDALLEDAFDMKANGASKWLLHMQIADNRITQGLENVGAIKALRLYETVLRSPARADWLVDPMDTMTVLRTPHDDIYENWFELAIKRQDNDTALRIADLVRRHRFFQNLPLGGRLLGLRWLLDGPQDRLNNEEALMRRDLLAEYPDFATYGEQAAALQKDLREIPWAVADPELQQKQIELLEKLAVASQTREAILRQMAVRREVGSLSFPPLRGTIEVRQELKEGQLALIFFKTSRSMHVFQIGRSAGKEIYVSWRIEAAAMKRAMRPTKTMLRELGNFAANRQMRADDLASTEWRETAGELSDAIFGTQTIPEGTNELIVVPDGMFWYVPFEALQLSAAGGQKESIISRMRVRYAPTMALILPEGDRKLPLPNTAIATGKMALPEPPELITEAAQAIAADVPGAAAIPDELPASSAIYGTLFDRLVILDEIQDSTTHPFGWSPLSVEKAGRASITLADWFALPFDAPREIIMPGYHTMAEDGLKTQNEATTGSEMFLSVMGMMSCGTRTILLSRWRTGGQTCYDLVREFVRELDTMTAAEAWQRCVFLSLELPLDPAKEARVNLARNNQPFKASHPFFWAGYMLFDSGLPPADKDGDALPGNVGADPAAAGQRGGIQGAGFGGGN